VLTLSVITPVYEAAAWLGEHLDSVAAVRTAHQHLVIDGGSTDGTVDLLRARSDPQLEWVSEPDRGQTHAVNKGLGRATGEIVCWINGDDTVVPEAIDRAVAHFAANPGTQVVYGGLDFTDAEGRVRRQYRPGLWSFRRYLLLGDYIPTPSILFRRERYEQVGPLDERWVDAADYDFYLRLMHGTRVDRLPDPHVRFRYHEASKSSRDVWIQQDEALRIRLAWARTGRQRAAMVGFDRLKRVVLPHMTAWPAPFAEGSDLSTA
jgi:glycosyltransferase involved in cell wall biosynthesis